MSDKTYTAIVTREDGAWLGDVPEVPGAHTFSRSLSGLRRALSEVVILMDDLPDDAQPTIALTYDIGDPALTAAADLATERAILAARQTRLQDATSRAAVDLAARYGTRDAAEILGITPGRVSQLAAA